MRKTEKPKETKSNQEKPGGKPGGKLGETWRNQEETKRNKEKP